MMIIIMIKPVIPMVGGRKMRVGLQGMLLHAPAY